jgi:uncharacterized protein with PIN domain
MVIDTSALVAIFFAEPEREKFLAAITAAGSRLVSAATVLETGIVLEARQGEAATFKSSPSTQSRLISRGPRGASMGKADTLRA